MEINCHTSSAFGNKGFFFTNKIELVDFLRKILKTRDNILLKGLDYENGRNFKFMEII